MDDYKVESKEDFYFHHSLAVPGLILLASFFFHVWISLVTSEVTEQKCPEVKPNPVKNKPEIGTYFQNSIREDAQCSHLQRAPMWVEEFAIALAKGSIIIPISTDFLPGTPLGGVTW